jgi:uncharacterized protein
MIQWLTILRNFSLAIAMIYLCMVILAYIFQARLFFYPGKLPRHFKFKLEKNATEIFLRTEDGEEINGLFFKGTSPDLILYFHGNAGDLSTWQSVADDFTAKGYNFLIIDYRGYGKSSGIISEAGLFQDAQAAWNYAKEMKFFESDIIIYGRSLGTGVAVELASNHKCKGLVLESPYTSLKDLAQEKAPYVFPAWWLKFEFNNLAKINQVDCPIFFIHGEMDSLIPIHHSNRLFSKFKGTKTLVKIAKGGHNDLHQYEAYHKALRSLSSFF